MRLSAGTTPCGAGWQSVGRLWRAVRGGLVPAGKIAHRISSPAPSATFIGGGFCMHARSPAMTQPYSPAPHPIQDVPANGPVLDPNTLIALLHSIGSGAASDGQPWPERHQMPAAHCPGGHRLLLGRPSGGAGNPAGRTACPRERRVGAIRWPARHGGADHGWAGTYGARQHTSTAGRLSGAVLLGGHCAVPRGGGCGTDAVAGAPTAISHRVPKHQRRSILTTAPPGDAVGGVSATTGLPVRRRTSGCLVPDSLQRRSGAVAGEALAACAVAGITGCEAAGARSSADAGNPPMVVGAIGLSGTGAGWCAGACSDGSGAADARWRGA